MRGYFTTILCQKRLRLNWCGRLWAPAGAAVAAVAVVAAAAGGPRRVGRCELRLRAGRIAAVNQGRTRLPVSAQLEHFEVFCGVITAGSFRDKITATTTVTARHEMKGNSWPCGEENAASVYCTLYSQVNRYAISNSEVDMKGEGSIGPAAGAPAAAAEGATPAAPPAIPLAKATAPAATITPAKATAH
jgi:hypothetical protein